MPSITLLTKVSPMNLLTHTLVRTKLAKLMEEDLQLNTAMMSQLVRNLLI
jgi:hypothetical protein